MLNLNLGGLRMGNWASPVSSSSSSSPNARDIVSSLCLLMRGGGFFPAVLPCKEVGCFLWKPKEHFWILTYVCVASTNFSNFPGEASACPQTPLASSPITMAVPVWKTLHLSLLPSSTHAVAPGYRGRGKGWKEEPIPSGSSQLCCGELETQ